jgi:hypothetical protein
MSGVVGSGLAFSGKADGAGFVSAQEIHADASHPQKITPVQAVLQLPQKILKTEAFT